MKNSIGTLFLLFTILISPMELLWADSGNFVPFMRSLNIKDYGYRVSDNAMYNAPNGRTEIFEVRPGDCSNNKNWNDCENHRERSELSERHKKTKDGDELWYGWHIYFPDDYVNIYPTNTCLGQFHQANSHPVWMFQNYKGGYFLDNHVTGKGKNRYYPLIKEENLRGRWHRIEVHVLWSRNNKGFFKVWVNGRNKVDYRGKTMDAKIIYFKYGIYRSFLSRYKKRFGKKEVPAQRVFYSNVKRGHTRDSLKP